ncbi:TonB-dependent receptor [Pacificibacter marinus]|uniref:Heme/hemopexin utilization protein C n=1 Tax=Pacificibacter marinus TaxID=658057 RepID=A0A1Y5REJ3_9RHOB|nr:TonB-dependent receptor [Pacificibacter marinus]SEK22107.1 hemoglobin/transferrin/lactoferrin receptor protein [Pacificibacter marinus]SLN15593.1 Heme/hemopexin utilization protein C precursor [Pacificibacter marinus]
MRTTDQPIQKRPKGIIGALMLGTTIAFAMGPALGRPVSAQSASETVLDFALSQQPLRRAVAAFSRTTGIGVAADGSIPTSVTAGPVVGSMTVRQGLDQLLAGTGYSYHFSGPNSVVLQAPKADPDTQDLANGGLLLDPIAVNDSYGRYNQDSTYEEAASIVYMDSGDIQRFRGVSTGDFLNGESGVLNGDNRNSGALDVNVRGMQGQSRVPVVIDGSFQESTVYRGYSGIAGRTYLDPDFVGSVSIEKGPSSGADGGGATGGVVRVSTLKPNDIIADGETEGVQLRLGVTGNTTDIPAELTVGAGNGTEARFDRPGAMEFGESWNGSIAMAKKFGNLEILAAYARRQTGNYYAGESGAGPDADQSNRYQLGEEVLNTSQNNTSGLLRGIYKWGSGQSIDLSYSSYDSDFGELMPSQIIRSDLGWQSPLSHVEVKTVTAQYSWNPENNSWIDLKADLYHTKNLTHITTAYGFSGMPISLPFVFASEAEQWGLNVSNSSELMLADRPLILNYGVSGKREFLRPPNDTDSFLPDSPYATLDEEARDGWRNEVGAFVAANYQATDKLTLDGSLRYIWSETQDNTAISYSVDDGEGGVIKKELYKHQKADGFAPIVSALYEISPGLQVYGKYAEAYRTPSLFESTKGWSAVPSAFEDLKPEHAKNKEIGVNFQSNALFSGGGLFQAKLAYFDNDVDNYITRDTSAGYRFVNIDHASMNGWEASVNFDTGKFFGTLTGSKYIDTQYCGMDGECSSGGTKGGYAHMHVPPETSATLTLGRRFFDETLELGARLTYIGNRASTDFISSTGGTNSAINWTPYKTVDLFGSYKINDHMAIDVAVDNVTDKYYMDSLTVGLVPSPGRTIRLGLTANF